MRSYKWLYFFGAVFLSVLMLSPYFWYGQPILNENYMFRTWFVSGVYSGLGSDNSFQWVSNVDFGLPRVGNPLFGTFYIPAYLGALIGEPLTSYILWLSSMILGLIGSWKFFSLFSQRRDLVFLAGALFVLSGVLFNTSVISLYAERMMFVPWTLYFFWKGVCEDRVGLLVTASVLHALHFLAATSFTWFYVSAGLGFVLLGYFVHLTRRAENPIETIPAVRAIFKIGTIFFGLCALLVLMQVLPVLEYASQAVHRGQTLSQYVKTGRFDVDEFWLAPFWFPGAFGDTRQLFFFANLSYLGWIPIYLSLLWLSSITRKQVGYVSLLLLCIILAAANMSPMKEIIRAMPGMAGVRFSSFWMLAWNFVIILMMLKAGERWGTRISVEKALRVALWTLAMTVVMAIVLVAYHHAPLSSELIRPLLVGSLVCTIIWSARKWDLSRTTTFSAIIVIALLDFASWSIRSPIKAVGINPGYIKYINDLGSPQSRDMLKVGGPGKGRALALSSQGGSGQPAKLLVSGGKMEWAFSFSSYPLSRSYEVVKRLGYSQITATGRVAMRMTANEFFTPKRHNLTQALNIKYYLLDGEEDKRFVEALGFKFLTHDAYSGFDLYEDVSALPRVVWYSGARTVTDIDEALSIVDAGPPFVKGALIEMSDGHEPVWMNSLQGTSSTKSDFEIDYQATKVTISGRSEIPGVLVLSDVNFPGWTVTVDGQEVDMFAANVVGRGVFVGAGDHVVVFKYRPWPLWLGGGLSALGWFGVLVYAAYCWISSRRQPYDVETVSS